MGLDCSGKFGVVFLVVLNIIFLLLGLGLLIPGILVQVNVDIIDSKIMPLLNSVSIGALTLGGATQGLSITMIVLGVFIMIVSLLGLVGACCQKKFALVVYAIIVMILFIGKVVVVILYITMQSKVESTVKDELKTQLKDNFQYDSLTQHEISTAWNYLNMNLKCCGVDAVTGVTNDFDNSVWAGKGGSAQIPKSCCGATESDYTTFTNAACTDTVTSGYYTTGCYQAIKDKINSYNAAFIGVGVTVLVVEILAVILACCICKQTGRDKMV